MLYYTLHVLLLPDLWCVTRDPHFNGRLLPPERRPQKTPNMPYLSRPIRRIEMLRISELHYVFQHEKHKLFLQPTLKDGDH